MLLAEDLLLGLSPTTTAAAWWSPALRSTSRSAQLIELTLLGRVDVTDEGEGRAGPLVVRPGERPADPLLEEALGIVSEREGKKPQAVVGRLGKRLRQRLYERLADQGILRAERGRVLGIFPTRS